ncbi:hypothetical protein [Dactylosporangium sp. CA-139066]|uniref:hypothetical protein n=1 Tax=Dactylosporangium sp. CA-139066 TaxID=3239930 RepID=UPI003D91EAC9
MTAPVAGSTATLRPGRPGGLGEQQQALPRRQRTGAGAGRVRGEAGEHGGGGQQCGHGDVAST